MKITRLKIEGMSCDACVASARRALQGVPGVGSVDIDLARGQASVVHGEAVRDNDLIAAVTDAGYEARADGNGVSP